MPCPQCQHDNPAEAKFCLNCGTRLAQVCAQCQQVLPPEAKFCMACGCSLTDESISDIQDKQPPRVKTIPIQPLTPDAERRQLTVMFCDLVGSTHLSGQLEPESLREVVRGYQEAAASVIERFDGYIAQYLGDGLLVYFGFPVAHEDDARRAIHAGLGIIESMVALNTRLAEDQNVQLDVRIAIHTGPVVVGDIGGGDRHEQLALGETPNIAARLEGLAPLNAVVISDATYKLAEGYFVCEELGEQRLRGVTQPINVYRAFQASVAQSRLDVAATRGLTPLVGRDTEVTLLLERWYQVEAGLGQVLLISGEAGIGKSRLVQALTKHITTVSHTQMECRSSPYFQNTALYPVTDMLQHTFQWQPDDDAEEKLAKLEQALARYQLAIGETVPLFAALWSLPLPEDRYHRLNLTPRQQRQKTLEMFVAILEEEAERQPVLLIIEDLHWSDPTTLELLDLLIDQVPTAAIFILLTCRPEFQLTWSHRSYTTEISLNRLSRPQTEQIVTQVASGKALPTDVMEQLVDKTGGVPLYVEEMTKSILESGVLKETDDQYELAGSISSLSIPTSLQDSLMSRLDRLMTAKVVAQLGATIGRQFSYALLATVSQIGEATLQRELNRLVEAELIYQRGIVPHATYIFTHALIQGAAYDSLLRSTRQEYHRRIVEVLKEHFPETAENQPELLAHHSTEAGLTEQAVGYWQRAGEHSQQRSAYVEALAHLTKGLELLNTLPDSPERSHRELTLHLTRRRVYTATKGYAAAEVQHVLTRAYELCQQIDDPSQFFSTLQGLWSFYLVRNELQTAREFGEQAMTLAQRWQNPFWLVTAHAGLGQTSYFLQEFVPARAHLEQGIAWYDPQQHRPEVSGATQDQGVTSLSYLALVLWKLGDPEQALKRSHEALSLAHDLSHPYSLAAALTWAARLHQCLRQEQLVRERAEAAITLAREQGYAFLVAMATVFRGWALVYQGEAEEGLGQLRQGIDTHRVTGAETARTLYVPMLAETYGHMGQPETGLNVLAETLASVDKSEMHQYEAELYRLKGELLLKQADSDEYQAASCFHQALSIAQHQQAKSWELRAATSLARLWQQQGKRSEARMLLTPVYGWFTEGFDTADLKDAKALLNDLDADISPPTASQAE